MRGDVDEAVLANFEIHENVLISNVELYWEHHQEFSKACEQLLKLPHDHLVLDLSHVTFIFSAYMGTIGKLLAEVGKLNKRLTIRVSANLRWLFELAGFDKLVEIEVVK